MRSNETKHGHRPNGEKQQIVFVFVCWHVVHLIHQYPSRRTFMTFNNTFLFQLWSELLWRFVFSLSLSLVSLHFGIKFFSFVVVFFFLFFSSLYFFLAFCLISLILMLNLSVLFAAFNFLTIFTLLYSHKYHNKMTSILFRHSSNVGLHISYTHLFRVDMNPSEECDDFIK